MNVLKFNESLINHTFFKNLFLIGIIYLFSIHFSWGGTKDLTKNELTSFYKPKTLSSFNSTTIHLSQNSTTLFDLPLSYNSQVSFWINYFQTTGRRWFKIWLERGNQVMPQIQLKLKERNLPLDLAYVAMIESGFSQSAISEAQAVGPWQFIKSTAMRYGLKVSWWLDERRDLEKSTIAAASYLQDLYRIFGSWYLVVASYNMGENGVKKIISRYKSRNYWTLVQLGAFSQETTNYVPKLLAALLIAKAPGLYGFRDLKNLNSLNYDHFFVPGGTDLIHLADYLGVTPSYMKELNAELIKGFVPPYIKSHSIKIPKRAALQVSQFVRSNLKEQVNTRLHPTAIFALQNRE